MNHVFVESNFLIDVARPLPIPGAETLFSRHGRDVTLYVPWVALAESKRTLDGIIREDLGFTDSLKKYAVREFLAGRLSGGDKKIVDSLADNAASDRAAAIQAVSQRLDGIVSGLVLIEPTKAVIAKTLSLFAVKSMKPFDEMILGAVLATASALVASGKRNLWFCNKNTKDFDPTKRPALSAEYASCSLRYLSSFAVP